MAEHVVVDVSEAEFEQVVVEASRKQPVLVDFWAGWCAPCRMLGPVLEKVAGSFGGRVVVAKVNVEKEEGLARRFGVTGIPLVKMFVDGRAVDEFTGALPEHLVRAFVEKHLPSPASGVLEKARAALEEGDLETARKHLDEAGRTDPESEELLLLQAAAALAEGDAAKARDLAKTVKEHGSFRDERKALLNRIEFIEECAGTQDGDKPIDKVFAQANCIAAEGNYEQALDLFLKVLSMDGGYRDGAAKKAMVKVFEIVGKRSPLADEYRDKMAALLY